MCSFWEASGAHSGSCRISGSFLAKAHRLLKAFSSESTAEGELASISKENPEEDVKPPPYLWPPALLCLHIPVSTQDMGKVGGRDGEMRQKMDEIFQG